MADAKKTNTVRTVRMRFKDSADDRLEIVQKVRRGGWAVWVEHRTEREDGTTLTKRGLVSQHAKEGEAQATVAKHREAALKEGWQPVVRKPQVPVSEFAALPKAAKAAVAGR